ncbi:MAG: lipopolysaccharide heptosyltransferase II [Thermoguttaceae bacterium]|nr:lipopolysaccharide heptosyltransferase II [Thermoguttaceae bacterium]MDW8038408.1 lipopolysaccharide heptosyltransferase II [Thermoguttaceae bacterium]
MKVVIFLPNWVGDLTMATPTLRTLRRHFGPNAHLVGIIRPYLRGLLGGTSWLNELWSYQPKGSDPTARFWAVVARLRRQRCDLAVLLTNSLRSGLMAALGGVRRRVGYDRDGRHWLLTDPVPLPRQGGRIRPMPMVEYYLGLADAIGCRRDSLCLELATRPEDEQSAESVWTQFGWQRAERPVVLNCSGAFGSSKLWPVEYFAQLAQRVVDQLGQKVLVFCGPSERQRARQIVQLAARENVVSMADQPMDFGTAKAVLRRGRLMVSTDSGPRHIAAAFGVPVITLYGPLEPIWSWNPTQRAVDLMVEQLDCLGCGRPKCPLGHHACMRELSVDRVYEALVQMWMSLGRQAA